MTEVIDIELASDVYEMSHAFSVPAKVLARLTEKVIGAVPPKAINEAQKSIKLEVSESSLVATATDENLSLTAKTTNLTLMSPEPFVVLIPAQKLLTIAKSVNAGSIEVSVVGEVATISSGAAEWELRLLPSKLFPQTPEAKDVVHTEKMRRSELVGAVGAVSHAVARNPAQRSLMSVCVRVNDRGQTTVTGCNGNVMHQVILKHELDEAFQIPFQYLSQILKFWETSEAEDIELLYLSDGTILSTLSDDSLSYRQPQHQYPDMDRLLLAQALNQVDELKVNREELAAALKKVRVTADPERSEVAIKITKNALSVSARDLAGNESSTAIACEWDRADRDLGVLAPQLLDVIAAYPEDVLRFKLGKNSLTRKPSLLLRSSDGRTTLVVPQITLRRY